MEKLIELHWVKNSRINRKEISFDEFKELIGTETEIILAMEPISDIVYVYINFDRNKKKKKSMWIKYLQNEGERNIDIEKYRMFYNKIDKFCE